MTAVDLFATEAHFLDHLAPIWAELPAWARGRVLVWGRVEDHARARGLTPTVVDPDGPWPAPVHRPTLVAAIGDYRRAAGRPRILSEHGAGQTYSSRQPSYAGGIGRDDALLFLVPNHHARRRNEARYPRIPNAVIGSPRVDQLAAIDPPAGVLTAAVSFHWRCQVCPETDTALDHFAAVLATARRDLALAGIRLVGHAHPRIMDEARAVYDEAGMEVLDAFEDVVARAHLYAVDNSSTLYEFAALDRPVVVLNAPGYRRGVRHGLRFWDAADVGPQVDHPEQLVPAIQAALGDPPELRRSRERALAHVYPVRDGTSARRAAWAVLNVVAPGRCIVCGAGSCACGGPTTVTPVDQRMRSKTMSRGRKKVYKNPRGPGYLRLSDEAAAKLGLTPTAEEGPVAPLPPAPESDVPKGAMPKGGPTARARAAAARSTAQAEADDGAPADDDDEAKEEDPKDKKRPAPSTRRRRKAPAKKAG